MNSFIILMVTTYQRPQLFKSGNNFDSDINGIIIEVAADALHISLYIFEESNTGNVHLMSQKH